MARMTLQELLAANKVGPEIWDRLAPVAGIDSWRLAGGGGNNENGNPIGDFSIPDPAKLGALRDYVFDWQSTGPANTGTLTAYDPSGNPVGRFNQQDQSSGSAFAEWAALAAAGFGGAALAGLGGPLGGLLGGAGGAGQVGSSVAGVGGEAAANLAAYGASLAPAEVMAGVGGLNTGAGIGGLQAAGAAGAAGGAAPGFWGAALKYGAPVLASAVGGLVQSNAAGKAASAQTAAAQQAAAAIQKALAPYQQAGAAAVGGQLDLLGLNGAEKQQAAINGIQTSPAFTSMQQQGENRILANASATGGLRGGNVQGALAQFSPALLSQLIDQQYSRLGGLTGIGANAAAGVGSAQANAQTQIGSAQAGRALANGSALNNLVGSGFGALGQYVGSQAMPQQSVQPLVSAMTPFGAFNLGGGF